MADWQRHILLSCLIGLAAALATAMMPHMIVWRSVPMGDIAPPLSGMDAWLHGRDPYNFFILQDGREYRIASYPFTAMLVLSPLLLLPAPLIPPLFNGGTTALLAYGLMQEGQYWRLLLFLSTPYWFSLNAVQWAPLFTAALLWPALLVVAPVKPQLGLVLLAAGKWNRWLVLGAGLLILFSLLLYPAWPLDFLRRGNMPTYDGRIPLLVMPGMLLLLGLLQWRERPARLLLALALVPQRLWYDQLPLLLIPQSWRALVVLVVCSWLVLLVNIWAGWFALVGFPLQSWVTVVLGLYLPALAMVLQPVFKQWLQRNAYQKA